MASVGWRSPMVVLLFGTTILFLSFGARQNLGLYMDPVSSDLGWGRGTFSFAVALQSLIWGAFTPIFGAISDRYGPARVLATGGILYSAGLVVMANASAPADATIGIGVLTGLALAMTGFPIVLSVIGRRFPPERRSMVLGIGSAAGSSGQLVLVPAGQWAMSENGWVVSMMMLAAITALIVPLAAALAGGNRRADDDFSEQKFGDAMREAGNHRGYWLLVGGYFVCGFQTMFVGAHLPAYLKDLNQPEWLGATALALIGGFNIIGCLGWGWLGGRYPKKYLLSLLYFVRAIFITAFMLAPITPLSVILFASLMGLLWLATVPLTTGLVVQIFGTRFMGTLVGVAFFSHQMGAFLGIWGGGLIYDRIGNYDAIFWGGVVLGVIASLMHFPINDRPMVRTAAQTT